MKLFCRKFGTGKPIVILHGLYGSSDNWVSIARALQDYYEVWLIDLRNHGKSPHHNEHNYMEMTNDLLEFVNENQLEKFALLGHSMGGKVAMHFSDQFPELISHLIIVDIAPKSYLFSIDIQSDTLNHKMIMQGMLAFDFNEIKKRDDIDISLSRYIKNDKIRHFLMKNIKRNQDMSFGWTINIDALYKNIEKILTEYKPSNRLSEGKFPVLFIKGSESDYITSHDIQEIKEIYPNAAFEIIPIAGHWLHVDQPEQLVKSIKEFLD